MKTTRIKVNPKDISSLPNGRIHTAKVDATSEKEIQKQRGTDDAAALLDAAKFAKRVRLRLGLTQSEFSARIEVPLDTVRNWEQGKRRPTGAAKVLLKILDKSPESVLKALQ